MALIHEQMANILKDIDAVGKEKTSVGKFSFKYRGIDDVMNALHTAFGTHGVFLQQEVLSHSIDMVPDRGFHHLLKAKFDFVAVDGSQVSCVTMGECIENGDKGIGKCMSYALKTCLLQTFLIPTEDDSKDPDSVNSHVVEKRNSVQTTASQRQSYTTSPKPAVKTFAPAPIKLTFDEIKADAIEYIESFGHIWKENTGKDADYYCKMIQVAKDQKTVDLMCARIKEMVDGFSKKS